MTKTKFKWSLDGHLMYLYFCYFLAQKKYAFRIHTIF